MSSSTESRLRRLAVAAVGMVALAIVAPSGVASAHAVVDDILPADGSALADDPGQVVIRFSEPILADGITVELVSSTGVAEQPTAALDPTDPAIIIVELPPLPDGTHQVRVTARDREDLHEVIARTSFGIGTAPPQASAPVIAPPEAPESMARWIFAAGLAALFGVLTVRSGWPDVPVDRPRRLRRITIGAIVAVVAARIGVLIARALALGGSFDSAMSAVLATADAGRMIFVVIAALCLIPLAFPLRAAWLDMPVRAGGRLSVRLSLGWLGVVWLAVLAGWGDHSALEGAVEPLMVLAKSAHLIGLGLWIGSLGVVLAVNWGRSTRAALVSVSRVAVLGAVLAVGSGFLLASRLIVSITALFSTTYGQLLVGKGLLVIAVAVVGLGVSRGWRLRWSVVELGALGIVVLAGSIMATSGPGIGREFLSAEGTAAPDAAAVLADDLLVQVRAIPGLPGPNTLEFRVSDTRRPSPGPVTGIDVAVDGVDLGSTTTLMPNAEGFAFMENVDLPTGTTAVTAGVTRESWPTARADLEVVAQVVPYVHEPIVSSAPMTLPFRLTGLVLVLSAFVLGWRLLAPQRRPDESQEEESCDARSMASP